VIYTYGITLNGTYHLKNDIVCQDAHAIEKCSDDMVIAAVADGLGSVAHSDIASRLAADISTNHCKHNIAKESNADNILGIIKASFSKSQRAIEKEAEAQGHSVDQYDTTLTLAILINDTLYYGHSGDSGIVALTTDGLYEKVTDQQRDDENRVFPLFFEDKWVFGQFDKKVCSVFLATDGMLETFFPFLIRDDPVNIHIRLAQFFMDNRNLRIDKEGESSVKARIEDFVKNIPDEQVNDDKTVVVLVNSAIKAKIQPDDYYKEPDWAELKQKRDKEWKRLAYPHLFREEEHQSVNETEVSKEEVASTGKPGDRQRKTLLRKVIDGLEVIEGYMTK